MIENEVVARQRSLLLGCSAELEAAFDPNRRARLGFVLVPSGGRHALVGFAKADTVADVLRRIGRENRLPTYQSFADRLAFVGPAAGCRFRCVVLLDGNLSLFKEDGSVLGPWGAAGDA